MRYPESKEIVLYGVEKGTINIPEIRISYNSDKEVKSTKISHPEEIADFLRNLYEKDTIESQEQFYVLYLNRANRIKGYYKQSMGGVHGTVADMRLIFAPAIKSLSSAIIVSHNHPSGNTQPSDQDRALTRKIIEIGKTMDIPLIDHIIITKDSYFSFAQEGELNGLKNKVPIEKKYTVANREIDKRQKRDIMKANNQSPKKVKNLSEEIKFIRRFVGLHNKVKSPNVILNFIKALQKSITHRLISKNSTFVKEIHYIQDNLIDVYNKMKGEMKILLEVKSLSKLTAISGGEEIYPSVGFIKAFINMQGKEISHDKKEAYVKRLYNAAKNRKFYRDDPFVDKLQWIYNYLKGVHKQGQKIAIEKAELSGLECICNAHKNNIGSIYDTRGKTVRQCRSGKYSDAKRGACSYNKGLSSPYLELGKSLIQKADHCADVDLVNTQMQNKALVLIIKAYQVL